MIKLLLILLLSITCAFGAFSSTFGLMNIHGEPLELIDLKLKAVVNLEAPYKETQYIATYRNSQDHPIEASFHFPRPGRFIFHKFEAIFRNQTLIGKIVPRENNQTEQDTSEIVNITIGKLKANETVQILFSMIQPLQVLFNKFFELKFPAITNQEPPFIFNSDLPEWNIQVEITSKKPFSILINPTHQFPPEKSNSTNSTNGDIITHKRTWNVTIPTDQDFIVYFAPERLSDIKMLTVTHPDDPNDLLFQFTALPDMLFFNDIFVQRTFQNTSDNGLLTLQKIALKHDQSIAPPQYIFMLDRSDSMKGLRFETLKKALIDLLQIIPESNKVEILSFGSTFEFYKIKDKNPYSKGQPTVKEAIEYVKTLKADMGKKDILKTMSYLINEHDFDFNRVIIILTDGKISSPDKITQLAAKDSRYVKTCALGIGANEKSKKILQDIGNAGGCQSEFVAENEELGEKAFYLIQGTVERLGSDYKADFLCEDHHGEMVVNEGCDYSCSLPADVIVNEWIHLNNKSDIKSCKFNIDIYSLYRTIQDASKDVEISNFENAQITDTNFYHKIAYSSKLRYREEDLKRGYYSLEDDNDEMYKSAIQQVIDQSIKYQILSRLTQLVSVLQETTLSDVEIQSNTNIQSFDL